MKILLILLFWLPVVVNAEVFEWQDANGKKHFSDQASSNNATKLDIKPAFSLHSAHGESNQTFFSVKMVYDGDTVVLDDGRKIRLLGINTPEVTHHDKSAEAGGEDARIWLINKLKNTKVRLQTDVEKTDKYGRTLAYLFTENNEPINLQLVAAGLAEVSIFPPNLLYANELFAAEKKAETARIGIWQRSEYRPIAVSSLTQTNHQGWTRVVGKVLAIKQSKNFVYLKFSEQFEARIERRWLSLFPDINHYVGKNVEVRGWLNRYNDGFSMLIRHPTAISLL